MGTLSVSWSATVVGDGRNVVIDGLVDGCAFCFGCSLEVERIPLCFVDKTASMRQTCNLVAS